MERATLSLGKPRSVISHEVPISTKPTLSIIGNEEHQNRCYVLIGLPATGKTHWCNTVLKNWRHGSRPIIIREDDFVDDECERTGKSLEEILSSFCLADRRRIFAQRFHAAIGVRRDVIVDGHNLTEDARRELMVLLPDSYQKIGIHFTAPDRIILERLTERYAGLRDCPTPSLLLQNLKRRYEHPEREEFHRVTNIDHTCHYQ